MLADVRFGSLADISQCNRHVRFTPNSGHPAVVIRCPLSANSCREQAQQISAFNLVLSDLSQARRPAAFQGVGARICARLGATALL